MLEHDTLRTAVRFALMNGFREDAPVITSLLQDLYRSIPSLFSTLLAESERHSIIEALDPLDEDEVLTGIQSDEHHVKVTATGCLQQKFCREVLRLPTRASAKSLMTSIFKSQLRKAFGLEYGIQNLTNFGTRRFQWCKKVTFSSRTSERRFSFALKDFIAYRDNAVGRIDGILIIHLSSIPRLFLKLRKAEFIQEKDPILGSPFLRETGEDEIVGLPATGSTKLYVLPVKDVHGDGPLGFEKPETAKHFMMVPWQIQYL